MSQPPPPPRRRNAPIVVYPGSPPAPGARSAPPTAAAPTANPGPRQPQSRPAPGPRRENGDRRRKLLIAAGAGALVIILIVVAVVAFGGGGGKSGPSFEASTAVDLTVGEVKVYGINPLQPIDFPQALRDAVLSSIGTYVDQGIVAPLRKGKADDAALAPAFTAAAAARLKGPDRALVLDEGLPKSVGALKVTTPPVVMNALADRDGNIVLVTANVDLHVSSRAESGTVKIVRTGSFELSADPDGSWKIEGWSLSVNRTGPGVTTSSTAAPAPATSAPPRTIPEK